MFVVEEEEVECRDLVSGCSWLSMVVWMMAIGGLWVGETAEIAFDLDDSFSESDVEEKMADKQAIEDDDNADEP